MKTFFWGNIWLKLFSGILCLLRILFESRWILAGDIYQLFGIIYLSTFHFSHTGKDIPQSRQSDIRSITTAQSLAFSSHMNSTVGSAMGSVNSAMGMSAPAVGLSSGVGSAIGIGSAMGSFRNESTPPGPASISMLVEEKTILPMMRVIARLWCHEITRTFGDRIVQDDGMCQSCMFLV